MSLRKYDLNLLTVLDALLRHRNVTQAGQELGLTQSATSHALLRLREQFGDKLLVPSGRSMTLTHRAESLLKPVADVLLNAEQIFDTASFDPKTSTRRFKIGMGDYVAYLLLPTLLNFLQETAPNVTLQVTWAGREMVTKLKHRELDMVISPQTSGDRSVHSRVLFSDELVVIAAKNHPAIGKNVSLDKFQSLPFAIFRNDAAGTTFADLQLEHAQVLPREMTLVPSFLLLPFVVASTTYISLIHRRLAEKMTSVLPIKILKPPFQLAPLQVKATWSHEANSDPAHRWFREQLVTLSALL